MEDTYGQWPWKFDTWDLGAGKITIADSQAERSLQDLGTRAGLHLPAASGTAISSQYQSRRASSRVVGGRGTRMDRRPNPNQPALILRAGSFIIDHVGERVGRLHRLDASKCGSPDYFLSAYVIDVFDLQGCRGGWYRHLRTDRIERPLNQSSVEVEMLTSRTRPVWSIVKVRWTSPWWATGDLRSSSATS